MSKSYKVPTIAAFLTQHGLRHEVGEHEMAESWRRYYANEPHGQDLLKHKTTKDWATWGDREFWKIAWGNPIEYLTKGAAEFFGKNPERKVFFLQSDLHPFLTPRLSEHVRDILDLRTLEFFARGSNGETKDPQ